MLSAMLSLFSIPGIDRESSLSDAVEFAVLSQNILSSSLTSVSVDTRSIILSPCSFNGLFGLLFSVDGWDCSAFAFVLS